MTMSVAAYGRLGQEPRSIQTKSNKPMCVCSLAVEIASRDGTPATQWLGLVAFGRVAEDLARHAKGDPVGVSGRVQQNTYAKSDGSTVTELQVVADAIVSARTVRPGGKRRASSAPAEAGAGSASEHQSGDFDDEVPY
jgi:single-strand DNA-binding protein